MDKNQAPDVSVIIVSFNVRDLLQKCLGSLIKAADHVNHEIIVVDNGSSDDTSEFVPKHYPDVKFIKSKKNVGFGAANNIGFQHAHGRYYVLLNTDAFLHSGALQKAIKHMNTNPKVGIGGAKILGKDGLFQPSARMFPSVINKFLILSGLAKRYSNSHFFGRSDRTWASPEEAANVDWVPASFSIIRPKILQEVGVFDERFFLYYEEVDLCRRVKAAGYHVYYWPDIVVTHIGGETCKRVKNQVFSKDGSQLTQCNLNSTYLYFRKHHSLRGVWGIMLLELIWHKLRILKNSWKKNFLHQNKVNESQTYLRMVKQAWNETKGGKIAPPPPW